MVADPPPLPDFGAVVSAVVRVTTVAVNEWRVGEGAGSRPRNGQAGRVVPAYRRFGAGFCAVRSDQPDLCAFPPLVDRQLALGGFLVACCGFEVFVSAAERNLDVGPGVVRETIRSGRSSGPPWRTAFAALVMTRVSPEGGSASS